MNFPFTLAGLAAGTWLAAASHLNAQSVSYALDRSFDVQPPEISSLTPDSNAYHGSSLAIDGDIAVVGAPGGIANGIQSGFVKVHDLQSGRMLTLLTPPSPANGQLFGRCVAISGRRVAVGETGVAYGKIHVFDLDAPRPTTPLVTIAFSAPSGFDSPPRIGYSCCMDGQLLVFEGVISHWSFSLFSGSTYEYSLVLYAVRLDQPETWTSPSATTAIYRSDHLLEHSALAASGGNLLVGLPRTSSTCAGRAALYSIADDVMIEFKRNFNNPEPRSGDRFGASVAIDGQLAVIGCPDDYVSGLTIGSVYFYQLDSATPATPTRTIRKYSPAAGDKFGISVAAGGTRVVVGTSLDDWAATNTGRAFVYTLTEPASFFSPLVISNPAPAADDQFGNTVAISGKRILIGAPYDDWNGSTNCGSVHVYDLNRYLPQSPVMALDRTTPPGGSQFGASVAMFDHWAAIGAPAGIPHQIAGSGIRPGLVQVHDLNATEPALPVLSLTIPDVENSGTEPSRFGETVLMPSSRRLIVGAPGYRHEADGVVRHGAVFVFDPGGATPLVPVITIHHPRADTTSAFGRVLEHDANHLWVGDPSDSTLGAGAGRVYQYRLDSATPSVPERVYENPDPSPGDAFGTALAVNSEWGVMVVGTPGMGNGAGGLYVYNLYAPDPGTPEVTIPNYSAQSFGERLGTTLGLTGGFLFAGAPFGNRSEDPLNHESGFVLVFDLMMEHPEYAIFTFRSPAPGPFDHYGSAIHVRSGVTVIGEPGDEPRPDETPNPSTAWVYEISNYPPDVPIAAVRFPRAPDLSGLDSGFASAATSWGERVLVGSPGDDTLAANEGAAYVFGVPRFELSKPDGGPVHQGGTHDFGAVPVGQTTSGFLTLRSTGSAPVELTGTTLNGDHAADFQAFASQTGELRPGASTGVSLLFTPGLSGTRTAALQIDSNADSSSPSLVNLTGRGLSAADDSDGDGLNDAAEYFLSALGFDWQQSQTERVALLFDRAPDAGLRTEAEIRSAMPGITTLRRDPVNHLFKVSLRWTKSTDLSSFSAFPAAPEQVDLNPAGEIRFSFPPPDPRAFFRCAAMEPE
jgi:hypothetical protein